MSRKNFGAKPYSFQQPVFIIFSFFNIYTYMIQNNLLTCRFDYVILLFNVVMLSAVIGAMLRIIEFFMLNKNIHL